jgi:hypothetical protein
MLARFSFGPPQSAVKARRARAGSIERHAPRLYPPTSLIRSKRDFVILGGRSAVVRLRRIRAASGRARLRPSRLWEGEASSELPRIHARRDAHRTRIVQGRLVDKRAPATINQTVGGARVSFGKADECFDRGASRRMLGPGFVPDAAGRSLRTSTGSSVPTVETQWSPRVSAPSARGPGSWPLASPVPSTTSSWSTRPRPVFLLLPLPLRLR